MNSPASRSRFIPAPAAGAQVGTWLCRQLAGGRAEVFHRRGGLSRRDPADHQAAGRRLARLAAALLLLSPCAAPAQWRTLANPHWNITLTDAGYSDFLLDNTPGFEGREYLSGEWGAAVAYQVAGQPATSPVWLEKNFAFPDWITDSDFGVQSPITPIGLNADSLPIAQSILTNHDLEITLRHEMLDTVVGTPMGLAPASATNGGRFIRSSRYVLQQTVTIRNLSGAPISGVQFFQFLHGLNAERGVYDARPYSGARSNFQYDVTLAGVDRGAAGSNSSSAGLEDYLAFHASAAPSAFEIGHYGIEGNGVDNHHIGKPSDGVHLSIEDNWQNPPFNARAGTDHFAPGARWVAGAQRWELGTLAAGQSTNLEILLSLRTGTKVDIGAGVAGSCNGGTGVPGGVDYVFEDVQAGGVFFADYSQADERELCIRIAHGDFAPFTFPTPAGPAQIWELSFTGSHAGAIHLTFAYDPTVLPPDLDPGALCLYQFHAGAWAPLPGTVDLARSTISVTTTDLSAFALGVSGGATYTVSLSASPANGGTVSGGGTFSGGASVTVVATPGAGYAFLNWAEGAAVASRSPSYTFVAQADRDLVANFVSAAGDVVITTSSQPASGGATLGDGAYAPGTPATVIAIPNPGYKFSQWLENGVSVSTAPTNTFTVTTNRLLVAKFQPVYTVTVSADPAGGGQVEVDSPEYAPGDVARLKALPQPGWCFVNWTKNGLPVSSDPSFQFNVTGSCELVGHFDEGHRIDASVSPGVGGTVSGAGLYPPGASVTLVASAHPGYVFLHWTEDGAPVSTSASYEFIATANRTLVAHFIALPPLSLRPDASGALIVSWPASARGWVLQECTNLSLADWADSVRPVTIVDNQNQVTVTPLTDNRYFRLVHP